MIILKSRILFTIHQQTTLEFLYRFINRESFFPILPVLPASHQFKLYSVVQVCDARDDE